MQIKNHVWEVEIISQAGEVGPEFDDRLLVSSAGSPEIGLLDALQQWREGSRIVRFEVSRIAGDLYDYKVDHEDARVWQQQILLGSSYEETQINFTIPDFWYERELLAQRAPMMKMITELLIAYKLESIEVDWL